MEIVNILWTGGWDSTYRMIELSRFQNTVNPIYIFAIFSSICLFFVCVILADLRQKSICPPEERLPQSGIPLTSAPAPA